MRKGTLPRFDTSGADGSFSRPILEATGLQIWFASPCFRFCPHVTSTSTLMTGLSCCINQMTHQSRRVEEKKVRERAFQGLQTRRFRRFGPNAGAASLPSIAETRKDTTRAQKPAEGDHVFQTRLAYAKTSHIGT